MHQSAELPTEPLTVAAALEGMANTVLLIGEWLLKQQQHWLFSNVCLRKNNTKSQRSRSR